MKIRLTTKGGFLTSAKHLIIEADRIDKVTGNTDGSEIIMVDGSEHEVRETPEQIEKLYSTPATAPAPKKKADPEPEA